MDSGWPKHTTGGVNHVVPGETGSLGAQDTTALYATTVATCRMPPFCYDSPYLRRIARLWFPLSAIDL